MIKDRFRFCHTDRFKIVFGLNLNISFRLSIWGFVMYFSIQCTDRSFWDNLTNFGTVRCFDPQKVDWIGSEHFYDYSPYKALIWSSCHIKNLKFWKFLDKHRWIIILWLFARKVSPRMGKTAWLAIYHSQWFIFYAPFCRRVLMRNFYYKRVFHEKYVEIKYKSRSRDLNERLIK